MIIQIPVRFGYPDTITGQPADKRGTESAGIIFIEIHDTPDEDSAVIRMTDGHDNLQGSQSLSRDSLCSCINVCKHKAGIFPQPFVQIFNYTWKHRIHICRMRWGLCRAPSHEEPSHAATRLWTGEESAAVTQGGTNNTLQQMSQGWSRQRDYLLHASFLTPLASRAPVLFYRYFKVYHDSSSRLFPLSQQCSFYSYSVPQGMIPKALTLSHAFVSCQT